MNNHPVGCTEKILSCMGFSSRNSEEGEESNANDTIKNDRTQDEEEKKEEQILLADDDHHSKAREILEEQRREEWNDARKLHERILKRKDYFVLGYGPVDDFHRPLEDILGTPKKLLYEAMEKEHCESVDSEITFLASNYGINSTSKIEWNFVIDPSQRGLDKLNLTEWPSERSSVPPENRRQPKSLEELEIPLAQINDRLHRIGLPSMTMTEVIACRLYAGPMGVKYNKMIRAHTAGHRKGQEWRLEEEKRLIRGNKYPTTIHVIQSAIAKLGKINPIGTGYSGIDSMLLPEHFWQDHADLNTKGGVEGGFMSLTTSREVGLHYASLGDDKKAIGILFEIEMSTMDRGADVTWLAQYPHEEETLLPPLSYLHVQHIRLAPTDHNGTTIMIVEARSRLSHAMMVEPPLLTDAENLAIKKFIHSSTMMENADAHNSSIVTNSKLLSRFSDDENFLITGNPMESVLGLPYFLGVNDDIIQRGKMDGIDAIIREITSSGEEELINNLQYVLYEAASEKEFSNGIRDLNNTGKKLKDFANHKIAKRYNLKIEHVAALRLYTTSAFRYINGPLRRSQFVSKGDDVKKIPHPFPITVSLIDEGIKRLRASTAQSFDGDITKSIYLWRGIKNTRIEENFLQGRRGGTELGMMSTTKDLKIAVEYSCSLDGNALLFKFKIDNMKQFGANVSWLSAFPTEEEILYPPLTFLQPTGRVETTTIHGMLFTSVEIQPHL